MQEKRNSSALAIELRLSCTNRLILSNLSDVRGKFAATSHYLQQNRQIFRIRKFRSTAASWDITFCPYCMTDP